MSLQGLDAALSFDVAAVPGMTPEMAEHVNALFALDPATRAEYSRRAAETNYAGLIIFVVLSLWPIALVTGILYLVFWRWMLRLQEHYADLHATQRGVTFGALGTAYGFAHAMHSDRPPLWSRLTGRVVDSLWRLIPGVMGRAEKWFGVHPTWSERGTIVREPEQLYDNWQRVAWSTAILSVGLDVIFASPLFIYHNFFVHLYPLTGLILLSTWLLPQLALGRPVGRPLRRALLVIIAVRAAWLGLNMLMLAVQIFLFPLLALEVLNLIVIAGSRYVGQLTEAPVTDPMMGLGAMAGAVGVELLEMVGLIVALALYIVVQRRAPTVAARRHWALVATLGLGIYAILVVVARWMNG